MNEKTRLDRQTMCNRLAMEFQDGWVANLGVGIPTLCSNFDFKDRTIIFHAENGVLGYGPIAERGKECRGTFEPEPRSAGGALEQVIERRAVTRQAVAHPATAGLPLMWRNRRATVVLRSRRCTTQSTMP